MQVLFMFMLIIVQKSNGNFLYSALSKAQVDSTRLTRYFLAESEKHPPMLQLMRKDQPYKYPSNRQLSFPSMLISVSSCDVRIYSRGQGLQIFNYLTSTDFTFVELVPLCSGSSRRQVVDASNVTYKKEPYWYANSHESGMQ